MNNELRHLAIIMDGNGRWAQQRGLPRLKGHEMGTEAVRGIVRTAIKNDISHVTLYTFSSENWNRPQMEVDGLFRLLERFIDTEVCELNANGVRLHVIGDLSKFSEPLQNRIHKAMMTTAANTRLHLSLALNYGGRAEIVRVMRQLAAKQISPDEITETAISGMLDTGFMPDPDLLIRTGGEKRISNFMLWQLAYTEIYFCDILWPDFTPAEMEAAILWFRNRQRRFGKTGEQIKE